MCYSTGVRRSRGVALATSLMLLALVLVIGLALATSSMMSLNLARQGYQDERCSLRARSAVNELIARLLKLESQQQVQLFNPSPINLLEKFPGKTELVPGCWVTFDRREDGFSTDNSFQGSPAAGWLDQGQSSRSVPPYTLELLLHAEDGGHRSSYRALVRRVWPYAVYSGGGPVVLSGDPDDPTGGSHVTGRVYSVVKDSIDWRFEGMAEDRFHPRYLLFKMLTGSVQPQRDYSAPAQVGPPVKMDPAAVQITGGPANPNRPFDVPASYSVALAPGAPVIRPSTGNALLGSIDYADESGEQDREVLVYPDNTWQGRANYRAAGSLRDPIREIRPGDGSGYEAWVPPARLIRTSLNGVPSYSVVPWRSDMGWGPRTEDGEQKATFVVWGNQRLEGSPDRPAYFVLYGNLINRVIANAMEALPEGYGNSLPLVEYGFELKLKDCVLHVKGDVDLCDLTGRDSAIKGIVGDGATLIVEGKLSVAGAQIRAGDRGMVIYAQRIALAGSGDFSGLLVSQNAISVIPRPGQKIRIRGGIVTSGTSNNIEGQPGIALHNVDVQYDPRHLRNLNAFGEYVLTAWEPL